MNNYVVSVVILTKNAGNAFEKTLSSLFNQDMDIPYEIIVVDSGSTDDTLKIINNFNVKLFHVKPCEFNFGLTRNYAFSLASGEFVVAISQDIIPVTHDWLSNIIAPFHNNQKLAAVQGRTIVDKDSDVFFWERKGYFYFTSESKKWIEKYHCGLSFVNCAIRRKFWQNHQIGAVCFSEDKYFQKIIHNAGMEIYYAEEAACYHGHQYTLKSLIKRLKNEGIGWKYTGVHYGLMDCLKDIYNNKWMIRKSIGSMMNGELHTMQEFLFPLLRPICVYYGNSKKI